MKITILINTYLNLTNANLVLGIKKSEPVFNLLAIRALDFNKKSIFYFWT